MRESKQAPTLHAYLLHGESMGKPADYYLVWCKYCRRVHRHTAGNGHRAAHCRTDSPYNDTGYSLKQAGTVHSADEVVPPSERVRYVRERFNRRRGLRSQ